MKQTLTLFATLWSLALEAQVPFTQPTASGLGFSVFVRQDAYFSCSDFDGAVAIGGTLTVDGHLQFCKSSDGLVTDKIYKHPVGLIVHDGLWVNESSDIHLHGKAWLNLGDCDRSSLDFDHEGTHAIKQLYRREDAETQGEPQVLLSTVQPLSTICKSDLFDFQPQFQSLEALSVGMNACANNVKAKSGKTSNTLVTLIPNRVNVWNIELTALSTMSAIGFENKPSIITPLVINVQGDGKDNWIDFPVLQGIQAAEGLYIIWNFVNIPQLHINLAQPVIGTLFAPTTKLEMEGASTVEGQIIAKSLILQHVVVRDRPFSTFVSTCGDNASAVITGEIATNNTLTTPQETVVRLYPNPSSDFVNIYATQTVRNFHIYNQLGQIVLSDVYKEEPIQIRNLPEGYYMIELLDADNLRMSLLGFQKMD